ncbi:MAG: sodium/glutamate symporter [Treponema sp.]|nr:MAG: sodium/glutamate symporter [Treponema sp.]
MNFEIINSVFTIKADAITTLAFAAVLLLLGYFLRKKVPVFAKYCIPAPVIGGFLFMIITWIGHATNTFSFQFDTYFQMPFMLVFFTTVGLAGSFEILKKGGKLFVIYWLIAGIIAVLQNTLGIGLGKLLHLDAAYAMLSSAIPLIGGHGAALAYGTSFEELGFQSAKLAGAAAATFGLIFAVLIGGPLGRRLVEKNKLEPSDETPIDSDVTKINETKSTGKLSGVEIMHNITVILVAMAVGAMISKLIGKLIGMGFPTYVGAMFVAVIIRNLNDKVKFYKFDFAISDKIGDAMLGLYLSLALMSLRLWELADLALPMLLILICQVVFLMALAYFLIFRLLGKNYDAAVMCSGLMGHGLGATPSAIVNMTAVTEKYGMSHRAFMIVPLVGAFLVDIIYQPATIWFIKTFVH